MYVFDYRILPNPVGVSQHVQNTRYLSKPEEFWNAQHRYSSFRLGTFPIFIHDGLCFAAYVLRSLFHVQDFLQVSYPFSSERRFTSFRGFKPPIKFKRRKSTVHVCIFTSWLAWLAKGIGSFAQPEVVIIPCLPGHLAMGAGPSLRDPPLICNYRSYPLALLLALAGCILTPPTSAWPLGTLPTLCSAPRVPLHEGPPARCCPLSLEHVSYFKFYKAGVTYCALWIS